MITLAPSKHDIMKIKLLTSLFCFATLIAAAQFDNGTILLGGNFNFSTQKIESTPTNIKMNSFRFEPQLNYYFNKNIAAGLLLGYASDNSDAGDYSQDSSMFLFAPTFKYSKDFKDKASFYGLVGIGFGSGKSVTTITTGGVDNKLQTDLSQVTVFIRPGFNYQLSEHLFLDMNYGLISYSTTKVTPPGTGAKEYKVNSTDIALNLRNLNLGVTFKF